MRKKRVMALILAAVMTVAAVTGCGAPSRPDGAGETAPAADTGSADDAADTGTASGGDIVELTFMGWEASPLETQAVKDGIAAFEAQYPNIIHLDLQVLNTMRSCFPLRRQVLFRM